MRQAAATRLFWPSTLLLLLSGCGLWGDDMTNRPTISEDQAIARVEGLIRETTSTLDPAPRLERVVQPELDKGNCLDPGEGESEDQVMIGRRYWLRDIPETSNGDIGKQIRAALVGQGFTITEASGIEKNTPEIFAHSHDRFRMSLQWSTDGSLSLGASSPCIWPDGTPEPS